MFYKYCACLYSVVSTIFNLCPSCVQCPFGAFFFLFFFSEEEAVLWKVIVLALSVGLFDCRSNHVTTVLHFLLFSGLTLLCTPDWWQTAVLQTVSGEPSVWNEGKQRYPKKKEYWLPLPAAVLNGKLPPSFGKIPIKGRPSDALYQQTSCFLLRLPLVLLRRTAAVTHRKTFYQSI